MFYLTNVKDIVIFGSKLTEKIKIHYSIAFMEDRFNMADAKPSKATNVRLIRERREGVWLLSMFTTM